MTSASTLAPPYSDATSVSLPIDSSPSTTNTDFDPVPSLDPLDALLNLEETFYQQGYSLGHSDGALQGLVEGRVFGAERGFDKFFAMSRLHGHAIVLGNRLPGISEMAQAVDTPKLETTTPHNPAERATLNTDRDRDPDLVGWDFEPGVRLEPLGATTRLEKHVRTLYALTEPASLALLNDEDEVSEFDDRFKRAQAKAVILGRMVGFELERADSAAKAKGNRPGSSADREAGPTQGVEASIEDASILQARH